MAFESLKARLGIGGRRRRYVDIESVRDLNDISDPETTEDESKTGVRDWASNHPVLAVITGIVAVLVGGIFLFQATKFAPGLLGNIWVQRSVAALLIVGYGYKTGWANHREKVVEWDELVLKMGDGATSYRGTYIELPGKADGFIPIKGWRKAGHVPAPYKNADLGAAMVESFNMAKVEDDDPAVIRLQPGDELAKTDTDWGTKLVQRTSGLKPDEQGNHTSLKAALPEYDDSRANDLAVQLEQVTEDYYDKVEEVEGLKRRVANLKDRLNEPIEEEVQKRMKEVRRFTEAADGRRHRQSSDGVGPRPREDFRGSGAMPRGGSDAESEIDDVEQELTADD